MMSRFIMFVAVFVFAFALTTSVAFASWGGWDWGDEINITTESQASVLNDIRAKANTGMNSSMSGKIETGMAAAMAEAMTNANSNDIYVGCGCDDDINIRVRNRADVVNDIGAYANTGKNSIRGGGFQFPFHFSTSGFGGMMGGSIETGDAMSDAGALTILNSNVITVD